VEIRDARPGDGEALARMWLEEGRYYAALEPELFRVPTEDGLAGWIEARLGRPLEGGRHLVADLDGQVAGFALVRLDPATDPDRRQYVREVDETRVVIDAVGTAEAFQRRGVATALVEAAEAWARQAASDARVDLDVCRQPSLDRVLGTKDGLPTPLSEAPEAALERACSCVPPQLDRVGLLAACDRHGTAHPFYSRRKKRRS